MPDIEFKSVTFYYGEEPQTPVQKPEGNLAGAASQAAAVTLVAADAAGATSQAAAGTLVVAEGFADAAATSTAGSANSVILDQLSLTVERGEFVAVIGANGSGKTTFARHINALLQPRQGQVLIVGLDTGQTENQFTIRSEAGMVFQNPNTQMVSSIVADDVAFGPENLNIQPPELQERVLQGLETVAMADHSEDDPSELSGGERQRVSIAGVLAMRPSILVLDEAGAMLDVRGRRGIRRIVRELNDSGLTVVLITHFMEEAILADRVIVLDRGQIVLDGPPSTVFMEHQTLRQLGLDVPFSMQLLEALAKRGIKLSETINPENLKEQLCAWYWNH